VEPFFSFLFLFKVYTERPIGLHYEERKASPRREATQKRGEGNLHMGE